MQWNGVCFNQGVWELNIVGELQINLRPSAILVQEAPLKNAKRDSKNLRGLITKVLLMQMQSVLWVVNTWTKLRWNSQI
jgi:hypothetical protein